MSTKQRPVIEGLVDQRLALSVYLESLLQEEAEVDAVPGVPSEARKQAPTPSVVALRPEATVNATVAEETPRRDSLTPEWGRAPFQCLLFEVAGLRLAAPLVELHGIVDWDDRITPLPNHSPWFLGLLPHRSGNVKIIDTSLLIVPAKHRAGAGDSRDGRIILIDDRRWGLVCDAVSNVVTLDPGRVRWRSARTKRAWLAGTVIDPICALLDVTEFARLLASDQVAMAN